MIKKTVLKTLLVSLLLTLSVLQVSCNKDEQVISFIVNITHSDYDIVESLFVTATIEVNGKEIDVDFEDRSNIQEGETRSIPITYESENSSVDLKISTSGMGSPSVQVSNVQDGDNVSWTIGDSSAQVNSPNDGDGDGDGNGDTDCKPWTVYDTECLSGTSDGTGSSLAGMRARVCKLSETSTTITVRSEVEAINGGIDNIDFYIGVKIYYGDNTEVFITKEDFNAQGGVFREYTVNKTDIHPSKDWDELFNGNYALVHCENN